MAIRYSGDVETRVHHLGDARYRVFVRWPSNQGGILRHAISFSCPVPGASPGSPKAVDVAALTAILHFRQKYRLPIERERGVGRNRSTIIRRVFQAPCPIEKDRA